MEFPSVDGMDLSDLRGLEHDLLNALMFVRENIEAQELRLEGDIESALRYEARCEQLRTILPEWAKQD